MASGTEAMVFRPTMKQFSNFSKYVDYMEQMGAHTAGIAKVIPPKGWRPKFKDYNQVVEKMVIPHPLAQTVDGSEGVYQQCCKGRRPLTVKYFKRLAETKYATPKHTTDEELDRIYWNSVTDDDRIYGADISASLFEENVKSWNLRSLGTIFYHVSNDYGLTIEGVNTTYLYFGIWKTSFPWHTEDCDLYSINYHHFGEKTVWYAIPPAHGKRFENLVKKIYPANYQACEGFLRHKTTIISPDFLTFHSIPYAKVDQNPGEFIITFPFGYHAGYNAGFNCTEEINFASLRWIEYGKTATKCTCETQNISISMDSFVKTYQLDRYEKWRNGEDSKKHPEEDQKQELNRPALQAERSPEKSIANAFYQENIRSVKIMEDWAKPLNLLWTKMNRDFDVEIAFNVERSLIKPHCAVCSLFPCFDDGPRTSEMPTKTVPRIPKECFTNQDIYIIDEQQSSPLLKCSSCKVCVHASCYRVPPSSTIDKEWLCQRCENNNQSVECMLCNLRGGAFKEVSDGLWVHVVCAVVIWNRCFTAHSKVLRGIVRSESRRCSFCQGLYSHEDNESSGLYTVQCDEIDCDQWFHVTCAAAAGAHFTISNDLPITITKTCLKHRDVIDEAMQSANVSSLSVRVGEPVIGKIVSQEYCAGIVLAVETKTSIKVQVDNCGSIETVDARKVVRDQNFGNEPIKPNERIQFKASKKIKYGVYKGQVSSTRYVILFNDYSKPRLPRQRFFAIGQDMPPEVQAELSTLVPKDWKRLEV